MLSCVHVMSQPQIKLYFSIGNIPGAFDKLLKRKAKQGKAKHKTCVRREGLSETTSNALTALTGQSLCRDLPARMFSRMKGNCVLHSTSRQRCREIRQSLPKNTITAKLPEAFTGCFGGLCRYADRNERHDYWFCTCRRNHHPFVHVIICECLCSRMEMQLQQFERTAITRAGQWFAIIASYV